MTSSPYLLNLTRQGRGPVLVLVHGVAGSRRIWDPVVKQLSRQYSVVRLDLLGYGHSPRPAVDYTPEVQVAAIRATLQHYGITPPFAMAGLSMGTLLVLEYARRWPADVTRLLCLGLPYYRDPAEARTYLRHSFWAGLTLEHPVVGKWLVTLVWGAGRRWQWLAGLCSRLYPPAMAQEAMMCSYEAFTSNLVNGMVNNPAEPLLAATAATRQDYLQGDDDRWTDRAILKTALERHSNCRLTFLPGVAHNTVVLAPAATAAWMLQVLETA